jgi:hypothetical protein
MSSHSLLCRSLSLLRWLFLVQLALATAALPASAAQGQAKGIGKRIALVVGNSDYRTAPALPNPVSDAAATKLALEQAGFEVVHVADADLPAMRSGLDTFARKVEQAGAGAAAVVFYAGHAVQVAGVNYLLPVDIRPEKTTDMATAALSLSDILKRLDATGASTKIVILDACRDNPFAAAGRARGLAMTLVDGATGRDDEAGLARIESKGGTLVAFSTSPGATAADGAGEHSPFAAAFLKFVREPGLPVEQLFRRVRLAVHEATGGEQTPWETSSLTADFKFIDGLAPLATSGNAIAGIDTMSTGSAVRLTRANFSGVSSVAAYEKAIYLDTPVAYQLFLDVYPDDPRAPRLYRMLSLRQQETAWAETVRAGDAEAYRLFMRLYPASQHLAEAEMLAARAPKRFARTASLACPEPVQPKVRKIELKQPVPPAQPKERIRKADREPPPIRRRPAARSSEVDDEPIYAEPPHQSLDPAIAIGIVGGILGVVKPRFGGYRGYGGYGGYHGMRPGGSPPPMGRPRPNYNPRGQDSPSYNPRGQDTVY